MLLALFVLIQFSIREVVFGFSGSRITLVLGRGAVEIPFHCIQFVVSATSNAVACLNRVTLQKSTSLGLLCGGGQSEPPKFITASPPVWCDEVSWGNQAAR